MMYRLPAMYHYFQTIMTLKGLDWCKCYYTSGISIGKYSIVGAGSVVTKGVSDYAVVVGNPAKILKVLAPDKFE